MLSRPDRCNADPFPAAYSPSEGTATVLDLDRLGVLRVAVGLRDVPLEESPC